MKVRITLENAITTINNKGYTIVFPLGDSPIRIYKGHKKIVEFYTYRHLIDFAKGL